VAGDVCLEPELGGEAVERVLVPDVGLHWSDRVEDGSLLLAGHGRAPEDAADALVADEPSFREAAQCRRGAQRVCHLTIVVPTHGAATGRSPVCQRLERD
jgi:hypothetical protein